jgi:hypothetical protein
LAQFGTTHAHITRMFVCMRKNIELLMKPFSQTGKSSDRPTSGRPCVTTASEGQYFRLLYLRKFSLAVTSSASTASFHNANGQTLYKQLREEYTRTYLLYREVTLTNRSRRNLKWARTVQVWSDMNPTEKLCEHVDKQIWGRFAVPVNQ